MIQPRPTPALSFCSFGRRGCAASLLPLVLAASACATTPPVRTPARERAIAASGRKFVPPFAYEAYVRGELALASGRPQEAALQLEMATAAPDEDAYLLSRLAEAQAESGEAELAQQTLADAERVDACEAALWLARGRWDERAGRLEQAAAHYRVALDCAPDSAESALALVRVLRAQGQVAESLALLRQAAQPRSRANLRLLLSHELAQGDAAEARFALESWSSLGAFDQALLEEAATSAVARREPLLALRLRELNLERLSPTLRAELAQLTLDRDTLQALLAQYHEAAFGGALGAARAALAARDYERAELYASLPPRADQSAQEADAQRALKVEALQGLNEHDEALAELRTLPDGARRRELARRQLARLGLPALTHELARAEQAQ